MGKEQCLSSANALVHADLEVGGCAWYPCLYFYESLSQDILMRLLHD